MTVEPCSHNYFAESTYALDLEHLYEDPPIRRKCTKTVAWAGALESSPAQRRP